jgi:protocatechuate 3,4-dioxygenase beta subunit
MNPTKLVVFLLLLLVVVGGFYFFGGSDPAAAPQVPAPQSPRAADAAPPPERLDVSAPIERDEPAAPVVREELVAATRSGEDLAQGVNGRVQDPFGTPLPGADVYLTRGMTNNLFELMAQAAKGVVYPPLAHARTDKRGQFKLGVDITEDQHFELRVYEPRFVEHRLPNLHVKVNSWYDIEPIKLERGAIVVGRVTIAGTGGLPVPDAEVLIKSNSGTLDISPIPGLERGVVAKVDAAGNYRFENAPNGIVTISAVAPKYARIEKANTLINAEGETEVSFELPTGMNIAGTVTDANNMPVAGAKVDANAISSKLPAHGDTRSDAAGKFDIIGLLEGPYVVSAIAPGFVRFEVKPVQSGEQSLQIRLDKQGSARLRVFGKDGKRLAGYRMATKKYFEGKEHFGNTDIPARAARPDAAGVVTVEGLDPGSYVFEVEARGHAKAYSEPFAVTLGGEPPLIDVHLNEGGVIEGVVNAAGGKPLIGVQVQTLPNHYMDNPFFAMLGGLVPTKITSTSATTDSNGRYRLTLLAPGEYQIKFVHPDYYEVSLRGQMVQTGQTTTLPDVLLSSGTVISGLARVGGKPASQVKVTVNTAPDPAQTDVSAMFHCEAISGNDGQFVLPKRIPPGRYQVMAARQTLANPMLQIADYAKTKQEIVLAQGQAKFTLNIQIPDDPR